MSGAVRVQTGDFDAAAEYAALRAAGGAGAVALFVGLVRDTGDLAAVQGLYLEHYPGMTERALQDIVDEAGRRWSLQAVRVVHRVGTLAPAEQIVLVGVASAHRAAAFAACEFIMDRLKTGAPFWKREQGPDGEARWVGQKATDLDREQRWHAADGEAPASR